jgi:hypothetical protein
MSPSTDNPAADLRRRQVGEEDGTGSSTPHAYAGNNESRPGDGEDKKPQTRDARKTYGRTRDGKGE